MTRMTIESQPDVKHVSAGLHGFFSRLAPACGSVHNRGHYEPRSAREPGYRRLSGRAGGRVPRSRAELEDDVFPDLPGDPNWGHPGPLIRTSRVSPVRRSSLCRWWNCRLSHHADVAVPAEIPPVVVR